MLNLCRRLTEVPERKIVLQSWPIATASDTKWAQTLQSTFSDDYRDES